MDVPSVSYPAPTTPLALWFKQGTQLPGQVVAFNIGLYPPQVQWSKLKGVL